ncbi:MAG: hypothetical protein M0006_16820 [Magnetospirillum sp.]|nr:hypothetical protein [Magnetospirillum sp.]
MSRRAAIALSAILFAAAAPAWAKERLVVPELADWKVVDTHTDGIADVRELVPANQTDDDWTQRLSIQAFRGAAMSAGTFLGGLPQQMEPVCDGMAAEPVRTVALDGAADAGRRAIACGRFKGDGKGNYTLYYAIHGREALYVLARAWRGAPFDTAAPPVSAARLAEWNAMFDAVRLEQDSP